MNTNRITQLAQTLHDTAGDVLAYSAPILAPIPSALAIFAVLQDDMGLFAALVTASAVEGLGFTVTRLALRTWNEGEHGRLLRAATFSMSSIYLLTVFLILVYAKQVEPYALSFPLLTIVGAGSYAVHAELQRKDASPLDELRTDFERQKMRIDLQAYKRQVSAKVSAVSTATDTRTAQPASTSGGQATPDDLRAYFVDNPNASVRQAAAALGMSKSWVQTWKAKVMQ